MVARGAGRVDALSAVQRERVKPERHRLDNRASEDRVDLDRQQVSYPPLSLRHDEPLPRATLRRPRRPHLHTSSRRVPPGCAADLSADVARGMFCCRSALGPAHP